MSIQNRLLTIYTVIFSGTFLLFSLGVYFLPRDRVLSEIDAGLSQLAEETLRPGNIVFTGDGQLSINLPENLLNLETASTLTMFIASDGRIIGRSVNLIAFDGYFDPEGFGDANGRFSTVPHGETTLRVLTVPIIPNESGEIIGYLQVARLLDDFERFNSVIFTALLFGLGAASASLFLAVLLVPRLFKPLERMGAIARQITKADDLSRRFPIENQGDEISDLARVFNQTLERLERLFLAQQRLLADVSHELRTPLTSIRGNIDLMRHMGVADPESMDIIQDEIERMTRLVGDLLLLARAEAGGLPLQQMVVELDNTLFEVYRQVNLSQNKVSLIVTDVDQVSVLGDGDRLKQLMINLVDNGVKYTPEGGMVYLSLSKGDGRAVLKISDTGIGIPPEDLPNIFDRFYRVDKARSRESGGPGGSGLGLSIVKWIVDLHQGNIVVDSVVGEGTSFTIDLPIYENLTEIDEPPEEEVERRPALRFIPTGRRRSS